MPSPIAHSLAGVAIHFVGTKYGSPRRWSSVVVMLILASLADVDFLPGYLVGEPRAYHWGMTHSLLAAAAIGVVVGFLGFQGCRRLVAATLAATAYGSHILLDMLLGKLAPSVGLQVFWPFSDGRFMLPWHVFYAAPRSIGSDPVGTLFSMEMAPNLLREFMVMAPIALFAWAAVRARVETRSQIETSGLDSE
jgi:inner membrane protein